MNQSKSLLKAFIGLWILVGAAFMAACSNIDTTKASDPIIVEPSIDSYFLIPVSAFPGFQLRVATRTKVKFIYNPVKDGTIYINRVPNNSDLLGIEFRQFNSPTSILIEMVGLDEQILANLSSDHSRVCYEPRQKSRDAYSLRGHYVPDSAAPHPGQWIPIMLLKSETIIFNNLSSIAVYDPPASSTNRLIFYIGCRKETSSFNSLGFVLATPATIAQPFFGFRWIPAK